MLEASEPAASLQSCSASPKNTSALRTSSATDLDANPHHVHARWETYFNFFFLRLCQWMRSAPRKTRHGKGKRTILEAGSLPRLQTLGRVGGYLCPRSSASRSRPNSHPFTEAWRLGAGGGLERGGDVTLATPGGEEVKKVPWCSHLFAYT